MSTRPVSAFAHQTPNQYPIPHIPNIPNIPNTPNQQHRTHTHDKHTQPTRSKSPTRRTHLQAQRPATAGNAALVQAAVIYGAIPRGGGINPDQMSERSMASSLARDLIPQPRSAGRSHTRAATQHSGWFNDDARLPQLDPNHQRSQSTRMVNASALSAGVPSSFMPQATFPYPPTQPQPPSQPIAPNQTGPTQAKRKAQRPGIIPTDTPTHYAPPSTGTAVRLNQPADTRRMALANWLHTFDGQREKLHRSIDVRPHLQSSKSPAMTPPTSTHTPPAHMQFPFEWELAPPFAPSAPHPRPPTGDRPPSHNGSPLITANGRARITNAQANTTRKQTSSPLYSPAPHPAAVSLHAQTRMPHGFFVVPAANAKDESFSPMAASPYSPDAPYVPHLDGFIPRTAALDFSASHPLHTMSHLPAPPTPTPNATNNAQPTPTPTVTPADRNILLSYFMSQSSLFRDTVNVRIENRELDDLILRGHVGRSAPLSAFGCIELLEILDSVSYRCSSVHELLAGVTLLRALASCRAHPFGGRRRGFNVSEWLQLKKSLLLFLSSPLCHFRDGLFDQQPEDPLKALAPKTPSLQEAVLKGMPIDITWPVRTFQQNELELFKPMEKHIFKTNAHVSPADPHTLSTRGPTPSQSSGSSTPSIGSVWYTPDGSPASRPLGGSAGSAIMQLDNPQAWCTFESRERRMAKPRTILVDSPVPIIPGQAAVNAEPGKSTPHEEKEEHTSYAPGGGVVVGPPRATVTVSSLMAVSNFNDFGLIPPVVHSAVDSLFAHRLVGPDTLHLFHFLHDTRVCVKSFHELEYILRFARDLLEHLEVTRQKEEVFTQHTWIGWILGATFKINEWVCIPGAVSNAQRHSFHPSDESARQGARDLEDWCASKPGSNVMIPQLPRAHPSSDAGVDSTYLVHGGRAHHGGMTDKLRFEQRQKLHAFLSSANCVLFHHITEPISVTDADLNTMIEACNEPDSNCTIFDFITACNAIPRFFQSTHELIIAVQSQPAVGRIHEQDRENLLSFMQQKGILDHLVAETSAAASKPSDASHDDSPAKTILISGEYLNVIYRIGQYDESRVQHMLFELHADGFRCTSMADLCLELALRRSRERRLDQFRSHLAAHIPPKPTTGEIAARVAAELAKRPQAPLFQIATSGQAERVALLGSKRPVTPPTVAAPPLHSDRDQAHSPYLGVLDQPRKGVGSSSRSPHFDLASTGGDFIRDYALSTLVTHATKQNNEDEIEREYREKLLQAEQQQQLREEEQQRQDAQYAQIAAEEAAAVVAAATPRHSPQQAPIRPNDEDELAQTDLHSQDASPSTPPPPPSPLPVLDHVAQRIYGDAARVILEQQHLHHPPSSPLPPATRPPVLSPYTARKYSPLFSPLQSTAISAEHIVPTPRLLPTPNRKPPPVIIAPPAPPQSIRPPAKVKPPHTPTHTQQTQQSQPNQAEQQQQLRPVTPDDSSPADVAHSSTIVTAPLDPSPPSNSDDAIISPSPAALTIADASNDSPSNPDEMNFEIDDEFASLDQTETTDTVNHATQLDHRQPSHAAESGDDAHGTTATPVGQHSEVTQHTHSNDEQNVISDEERVENAPIAMIESQPTPSIATPVVDPQPASIHPTADTATPLAPLSTGSELTVEPDLSAPAALDSGSTVLPVDGTGVTADRTEAAVDAQAEPVAEAVSVAPGTSLVDDTINDTSLSLNAVPHADAPANNVEVEPAGVPDATVSGSDESVATAPLVAAAESNTIQPAQPTDDQTAIDPTIDTHAPASAATSTAAITAPLDSPAEPLTVHEAVAAPAPVAHSTVDPPKATVQITSQCQVCHLAESALYCAACNLDICSTNKCDSTLHSASSMVDHVRVPMVDKDGAIRSWRLHGFPSVIPAAASGPLCQVCSAHSASHWCGECQLDLCTDGGCDATLHSAASLAGHARTPIEQKNAQSATKSVSQQQATPTKQVNETSPAPAASEVATAPAPAPTAPTTVKRNSAIVLAQRKADAHKPAEATPPHALTVASKIATLRSSIASNPALWSSHAFTLTDAELSAILDACGGSADFLPQQIPLLLAAKRQFPLVDELSAWTTIAWRAAEAKQPIIYHAANAILLQPLKTLLDSSTCMILPLSSERTSLYTTIRLDQLVQAGDGVSDTLSHMSRLHELHRSFDSADSLIESLRQVSEMGFFLPRPLLQRIVDYVKKKPSGTPSTQLFAPLNHEVPEMDAELLDSLVANLGVSPVDETRWAEPLATKVDVCIGYLRQFDQEHRQFESWESLCETIIRTHANDLRMNTTTVNTAAAAPINPPSTTLQPTVTTEPSPVPIAPAPAVEATPAESSPAAVDPSGVLTPAHKQEIMSALSDESFSLFDDVEEDLSITQAGLEKLVLAAGEHGIEGLLHILAGLNSIGRRAKSFHHLIDMVGEVVEDGAYSSRPARQAIIDLLCDEEQCQLYCVGNSSSLSGDTITFLRSTPPAALDALILALGGSSSVPTILDHLTSLSRVGNRFENFDEILTALTHALDPNAGGGSFIAAKDWKGIVTFLTKNKAAKKLLPAHVATQSAIEQSMRAAAEAIDNLFALSVSTSSLLSAAHSHPLALFGSSADDDSPSDLQTPDTAFELIIDQLEQMSQPQPTATTAAENLPQLIDILHQRITQMKEAKEAEEARKVEMMQRLNRAV